MNAPELGTRVAPASLKVMVTFENEVKFPPASDKNMNFCPPGPTRSMSKSVGPCEAVKLFRVKVSAEIVPAMPETVMFDETLETWLSGMLIEALFENTVFGMRGGASTACDSPLNPTSFDEFAPNAAIGPDISENVRAKSN